MPRLQLFASKKTLEKMSAMVGVEGYVKDFLEPEGDARLNIEVCAINSLDVFAAGRYEVTAFPSGHDPALGSLLYAITEGGSTFFYGTDTDVLLEDTWKRFHERRMRFNVVVLDQTYGPDTEGGGHLNANRLIQQVRRMKEEGLLVAGARILATHISHEGNPPHDELSEYASKHGYEIAYDGLVIDVGG